MISVLDDADANLVPKGRVIVRLEGDDVNADRETIAAVAGYASERHYGYTVTDRRQRSNGGTLAVVILDNHDPDLARCLVHDTGCYPHRDNGFRRQQVWLIRKTSASPDLKVRLTCNRANADEDASYTAEAWTPMGWVECVSIPGTDPRFTEGAGMPPGRCIHYTPGGQTVGDRDTCEQWSITVLATLLTEAIEVARL